MIPPDRIRRLFSSPIFLFICFSLLFGAILLPFAMRLHSLSWIHGFLFGIPLGLITTILILWHQGKSKEFTGNIDGRQLKALAQVVETGVVPDDPQIRKLLPQYLRIRFPASTRPKKTGIIFTGIMLALNLPISIAQHNPFRLSVWAVFFAVALISHYYTKRIWAKVDNIYWQLGIDPEAPPSIAIPQNYPAIPDDAPVEVPSKPLYPVGIDQPVDEKERERSKWILLAALVVGVALFVLFTKPAPQPTPEPAQESTAVTSTESQSNETVGTVEENSDESLDPASVPVDPSGTTGSLQGNEDLQSDPSDGAVHQYTVDDEPTN